MRKKHTKLLPMILCLSLILSALLPVRAANATVEHAYALYELGLFQGTSNGFQLEQRPTRIEGLTMFVRLLGGEAEAISDNSPHPFSDVPVWGDPYVGYAWKHALTKGTSNNTFGSTDYITLEQYVTFVLRALHYDDSKGDFTWNTAVDKAVEIGLLSRETAQEYLSQSTSRGTMVDVSFAALTQTFKDSPKTLTEQLVEDGVFTREAAIEKGLWPNVPVPTQTPVPTSSPAPSPTSLPTPTPAPTSAPTLTPAPTSTPTPTPTPPTPTPTPDAVPSAKVYGIVSADNGNIKINGAIYRQFVVNVNGKEYTVNQKASAWSSAGLKKGRIVGFEPANNGIYESSTAFEVVTDGVKQKNGVTPLSGWVKEYVSGDGIITLYDNITYRIVQDAKIYDTNVTGVSVGLSTVPTTTYALDSKVEIYYVDTDSDSGLSSGFVNTLNVMTGYKTVYLLLDDRGMVVSIIAEVSGEQDVTK